MGAISVNEFNLAMSRKKKQTLQPHTAQGTQLHLGKDKHLDVKGREKVGHTINHLLQDCCANIRQK